MLVTARKNMLTHQIRAWEVLDDKVLKVFSEILREDFVPEEYITLAYADIPINLKSGHVIPRPSEDAKVLQALQIKPEDSILQIGLGSGFLTACMARQGKSVVCFDIDSRSIQQVNLRLAKYGISNVQIFNEDGIQAVHTSKNYDIVVVSFPQEKITWNLLNALKIGGKLLMINCKPVSRFSKLKDATKGKNDKGANSYFPVNLYTKLSSDEQVLPEQNCHCEQLFLSSQKDDLRFLGSADKFQF